MRRRARHRNDGAGDEELCGRRFAERLVTFISH
jgi:hypothetical protein